MGMPKNWRGSDLRTRTEVVQYLADRGGEIVDAQGRASAIMQADLGRGRALTQLLADMEADKMISREIRGRRTFSIKLRDDWGLVDSTRRQHLRAVPEAPAEAPLVGANVDLELLADTLLAIVVKRASAPAASATNDTQAQRELARRLRAAETAYEKVNAQLREANEERRILAERNTELAGQVAALDNNLALMQRELTRKPTGRGNAGVALIDRLDEESRGTLAALMSSLPETPESKPRKAQATKRARR